MSSQRVHIRVGEDLGRAVAELRRRRGLTQEEAGDLTGLSKSYVSKIESGRSTSLLDHELRILRRLGARVTVEFDDGAT
ncbi:MAG: helix-turn-helix transcriptional regulator [Ilumatobacter sp.]|nr:helix-turn-helix transcriptional regulator [Ilumatobacter sp.]